MTGAVPAPGVVPAQGAASGAAGPPSPTGGSIYDLGYQRYDGPRLGRRHAIRALFGQGIRVSFGIGRGGGAKVVPFVLGFFAIVPAILAVGLVALTRQLAAGGEAIADASPVRHDSYYSLITTLIVLFCAIQAPEIVGRDLRHGLPTLYFSRALRRLDYSLARVGALVVSTLVLLLLPQAILLLGLVLSAQDVLAEFGRELGLLPAIVGQALIISGLLAAIATCVSAFTPRRAYATTAIVALLLIPSIVANLVATGSRAVTRLVVPLSPLDLLAATNDLLFGRPSDSGPIDRVDLPGWAFLAAAVIMAGVFTGILIRRIERIDA